MILLSLSEPSKYRDPLQILLEYVTEVSTEDPCIVSFVLTWTIQQASECDMILVHDDDLAKIQGNFQSDALMAHLQRSKPEIQHVLYG
jgi:hypothetical protein